MVAQVDQDDPITGREVEVAHRRQGRADEDVQPLPFGPKEDLHQDVGRDVVRRRLGRHEQDRQKEG